MKKSKILITLLLSIILSCSNPLEQKKDETTDIKKDTSVSQKEIEKHNKNALETQRAFINVYKEAKDSIVNIRTKKTVVVNTYNPLEELLRKFRRTGKKRIRVFRFRICSFGRRIYRYKQSCCK